MDELEQTATKLEAAILKNIQNGIQIQDMMLLAPPGNWPNVIHTKYGPLQVMISNYLAAGSIYLVNRAAFEARLKQPPSWLKEAPWRFSLVNLDGIT